MDGLQNGDCYPMDGLQDQDYRLIDGLQGGDRYPIITLSRWAIKQGDLFSAQTLSGAGSAPSAALEAGGITGGRAAVFPTLCIL